jgi:hypothetical protein
MALSRLDASREILLTRTESFDNLCVVPKRD